MTITRARLTGDTFGCSVAFVGDVNVDGSDDLLIGAFRYPEIQSLGQAYLYFGGPAIDSVKDASSSSRTRTHRPGFPRRRRMLQVSRS